jgi:hypothetical protein
MFRICQHGIEMREGMMRHIEVEYLEGNHAFVDDHALEGLIRLGLIKEFYRPSESRWITIGIDAVRGAGKTHYSGCERRRTGHLREMVPVGQRKDARIPC